MNNMMDYATLNIAVTKFTKTNKSFSMGRARIFYIGANQNRSIIDDEVAERLIQTIPGTPIVGKYDAEVGDFKGHGANQIAYGFIPLEPHASKVVITEEVMGMPIKRTYYEVDVVIWDGRFPEAAKILGEEKSLSMELNSETIQGEFEVYEGKRYLKFTYAEFIGVTVLGADKTPCFKDAKFLTMYSSMLSAYTTYMESESENNIGGTKMEPNEDIIPEVNEIVDSIIEDATIINEVVDTIVDVTVETVATEVAPETIIMDTPEIVEDVIDSIIEEIIEEPITEVIEEVETGEVVEEINTEVDTADENETVDTVESLTAELSAITTDYEKAKSDIEELTAKLDAYENEAKIALVDKFSKKIINADFVKEISEKLNEFSVEELKTTLGNELAEQVLREENEDGSVSHYSFSKLIKSDSTGSWKDLVRKNKQK